MSMTDRQRRVSEGIKKIVKTMMDRVMVRVLKEDPFVKETHHANRPIYAALVPDEIFKNSHFERRFVTPFGKVWEKLAQVVANEVHDYCEMGYSVQGNVSNERLRRIQEVLNRLEHSARGIAKKTPDWDAELAYILEGQGESIPVSVTCDIYIKNDQKQEIYAFELKAPLPNSDQTKVSKEKIFKLLAMEPQQVTHAFFALPYNPYGKREDYGWAFPQRWFDMHQDASVLIGDGFWDFIGGEGTYQIFVSEINALGKIYREQIYREFLGIEPPNLCDERCFEMSNKDFTFIDLFSGIGGFRLALEKVGGKCQGFSEINSDAIATYCQNFKETTSHNFGDITKINDLPQHDLMTAGVPCQSWSIAGKNLGFDDDRGQLWNDTIYLLQKNQPKAFIFENVKGLTDPRNKTALDYILQRIKDAGYYANYYLINSYDYGVLQHRQRVYIIGFKNNIHCLRFKLPDIEKHHKVLGDVLEDVFYQPSLSNSVNSHRQFDLLGDIVAQDRSMSLSNKNGLNDYFLFNDLRNGHSTIHSWDILETSNRQKHICLLLLKNRRKKLYGELDGNPLSLNQFISIDSSITQMELDELVSLDILKKEEYLFQYHPISEVLTEEENIILSHSIDNILTIDHVKNAKNIVKKKVNLLKTIGLMKEKKMLVPIEVRYDFKYTKISTGIFGINRIFLPTSDVYPTLVASDGNDFIATCDVFDKNPQTFKDCFLNEIYKPSKFRKINVSEACEIQGFPKDFVLPKSRARWMKLIGNSVSVPVIYALALAIKNTGVFDEGSE